jgi:hypothetical protein
MDQNYITKDQFAKINEAATEIAKKTSTLMDYLRKTDHTGTKFKS